MLDNTLQLLCEGEFEWGPEDTIPSLRATIVQQRGENRRLKAELAELQERYDDLARWSVRVVGTSTISGR